jgi:16S rRNA processing protein RimM
LRGALREGYHAVGVALTSFGLQGEIKVEPLTAFADRFNRRRKVWFAGEERTIQRSRWTERGVVVLKLSGIDTPEQVAALRGEYLQVPEADRPSLPEGEYYQDDLLGLSVRTTTGEDLGTVAELLPTGANDVLVVRGEAGEHLIPLIDDIVVGIDMREHLIIINPLPGLLGDSEAQPEQRSPDGIPPRRAAKHPRGGGRRRPTSQG